MPLLFIVQLLAVAAASCIDSECDGHGMLQVHMDNHSDGNRQGNMFQQYKNTRERDIGMLNSSACKLCFMVRLVDVLLESLFPSEVRSDG